MTGLTNVNPYAKTTYTTTRQDRALRHNPLERLAAELNSHIAWYKGAKNIRTLNLTKLSDKEITDIPAGFLTDMGFESLDKVILSENAFTKIPEGIKELKVRELVVDYCRDLTDLSGIAEMEVEVLEAEHCGFNAWPAELNNSQVKSVNLIGNAIQAIEAFPQSLERAYLSGIQEQFTAWCAAEGKYATFFHQAGLPVDKNALAQDFEERLFEREDGHLVLDYVRVGKEMELSDDEGSDQGVYSGSSPELPSTPEHTPPMDCATETPGGFREALAQVNADYAAAEGAWGALMQDVGGFADVEMHEVDQDMLEMSDWRV